MAYEYSFGQWIVERRKKLNLQRTKLAEQIGCAVITLRKIETDERRPSEQLAQLLAKHLGLTNQHLEHFVRVARGTLSTDWLPDLHTIEPTPPTKPYQTNLPSLLTTFIGRKQELSHLTTATQHHRLITLTGVGGVGKTRLAIEYGAELLRSQHAPPDGVWLVELAALSEPTLIVQSLISILQIKEEPGHHALDLLKAFLRTKQLLIILDNCEHLIATCATLVETILFHCWQVRILATSREPLLIAGERVMTIPPLHLKQATHQDILSAPASQLLLDRISLHHLQKPTAPTYQSFTSDEITAIGAICHQLDGIPLAIELTAPLTQHLTLEEIAHQLHRQMSLLNNTYRTTIPRHQTMHHALVWSYRLLAPDEQCLLAAVSVFAGGWALPAAQVVCPMITAERLRIAHEHLVMKSLALHEHHNGQLRYRLLEPVRQFAYAQLQALGQADHTHARHAHYFLELAEQMHRARDTSREGEWLDRLEPEKDNLRAVNMWAIANHQAEFAHRFNGYLFAFWIYRISAFETRHWIDAALKLQAAEVTTNSQIAEALALDTAGYLAIGQRDFEYARHCFQRELDIYHAVGQQAGIATGYRGLGFTAMQAGDLEYATAMTTQSLAVSEAIDDQWGMAWSLFDLGYLALVRGDYQQARSFSEQALPRLQDQDIQFGLYRALIAHGHILRGLGENQAAQHAYYQALHMQQRLHYTQQLTDVLESLADIATMHGDAEWAASIFGFTQQHSVLITLRWRHLDTIHDHALQQTRQHLSAAVWERALRQGQQMSLDQAVAYALAGPRLRSRAQNG